MSTFTQEFCKDKRYSRARYPGNRGRGKPLWLTQMRDQIRACELPKGAYNARRTHERASVPKKVSILVNDLYRCIRLGLRFKVNSMEYVPNTEFGTGYGGVLTLKDGSVIEVSCIARSSDNKVWMIEGVSFPAGVIDKFTLYLLRIMNMYVVKVKGVPTYFYVTSARDRIALKEGYPKFGEQRSPSWKMDLLLQVAKMVTPDDNNQIEVKNRVPFIHAHNTSDVYSLVEYMGFNEWSATGSPVMQFSVTESLMPVLGIDTVNVAEYTPPSYPTFSRDFDGDIIGGPTSSIARAAQIYRAATISSPFTIRREDLDEDGGSIWTEFQRNYAQMVGHAGLNRGGLGYPTFVQQREHDYYHVTTPPEVPDENVTPRLTATQVVEARNSNRAAARERALAQFRQRNNLNTR